MLKNCDSEVGYKTNYGSAWLTRSSSLVLRMSEYTYVYVFNHYNCNRLYFLIGYSKKKNKETLLFARISNIYLVQIEKYSRNHFTYSPYLCLSVYRSVHSSVHL